MTPQELRNSILQLAVQGKLVEQRPEEGTAEELLIQIRAEKERLSKAGLIKKEKPLPKITESEIPFDIPESWKWSRISHLSIFIRAGGDKPRDFVKEKTDTHTVPVIANGIQNDGIIGFTKLATIEEPCITVSGRGTIGFSCIRTEPFCPIVRLLVLNISKEISLKYMQAVLTALLERGVGTSIQQLTVPMLEPKIIPIPPLGEQKRIVAKIEELLPYIDRYDQAWNKLEIFNKQFPTDLQKSILQMAIQGKLVEQRPEEGTGEELYRQIQVEKQKLIKAGTIKKEKPLPVITEDEKLFEIPESWKLVRLGDCSSYNQHNKKVSASSISNEMWSLDLEDIEKDTGRIKKYCRASERSIIGDKVQFYKGQILYSKLRPYLKKILLAPADGICSSEIVPFFTYGRIVPQFLVVVLKAPYIDYLINSVTYGIKMPRVGTETMVNLLIPLPPLAEQKRITTKLDEILPLCEKLKLGEKGQNKPAT